MRGPRCSNAKVHRTWADIPPVVLLLPVGAPEGFFLDAARFFFCFPALRRGGFQPWHTPRFTDG
jgi:hypothetical protein